MAWERTNYLMEFVKRSLNDDELIRTDKNIQNNEVGFVPLIKSSCSSLFTFKKDIKPIEIEEPETKETNDEFEFSDYYLTKMYRFQSNNTDVISQADMETVKTSNWKGNSSIELEEVKDDDDVQIVNL